MIPNYVDVHAHLTHEQFHGEEDAIVQKCTESGLEFIVCNGLEPVSNRQVLDLSLKYPTVLPALGIYPLDAACNVIERGRNWNHEFDPPTKFDIESEIAFIDSLAAEKKIVAVGECGLDKHYLTDDESMEEQERVLRLLMRVNSY
jgi:TatD DNase family protein